MGLLPRIRRHAAIAAGDFAAMFKEVEIPPLPAALRRLVTELENPAADIEQIAKLISAAPGLAARIIRTVNSSLYGLRKPVASVKHAVTLLGLRRIRSLVLTHVTREALPRPDGDLFVQEAFWTDSVLRALLSRSLAKPGFGTQAEDAFTASLLADVALPVLLSAWSEYYAPIVAEWRDSPRRLSEIERDQFGWDHAQAGAWIVQQWGFPEEMICYIGAHDLSREAIHEHELADTVAAPVVVAALAPSVLKPSPERAAALFAAATGWLSLTPEAYADALRDVKDSFAEILRLFEVTGRGADGILEELAGTAPPAAE